MTNYGQYNTKIGETQGGDVQFFKSGASQVFEAGSSVQFAGVDITGQMDPTTRFVSAGATLTMTLAAHFGKIIKLDTLAGSVVTLPAATGSGAVYRFVVSVVATSNSHIIKVANSSDTMQGLIFTVDDTSDNAQGFIAGATADTITLNRTTTGSVSKGECIEITDFATNVYHVKGFISNTGTAATPFSATV